jgi:hypothetical protein
VLETDKSLLFLSSMSKTRKLPPKIKFRAIVTAEGTYDIFYFPFRNSLQYYINDLYDYSKQSPLSATFQVDICFNTVVKLTTPTP